MNTKEIELVRKAMSVLGKVKSEKKARTSRENGKLGGDNRKKRNEN